MKGSKHNSKVTNFITEAKWVDDYEYAPYIYKTPWIENQRSHHMHIHDR